MLKFDKNTKTGALSVINDGETAINFQITAEEWTQDENGKDVYTATNDISYFPRMLTVNKGEERVVRVGIKQSILTVEKTYRLWITEMPDTERKEGLNIAMNIKFGSPLFIAPIKETVKGDIDAVTMGRDGRLGFHVTNKGNVHFFITGIDVTGLNNGKPIFKKSIAGWYLLANASRVYISDFSDEFKKMCGNGTDIKIEVITEDFPVSKTIKFNSEICAE
jgi:fimbrial chaperone protein